MRLRISHETAYRYATPAHSAIQTIRLTPRGHDGQFVVKWQIEVDRDCRLESALDAFGNTVHSFTVAGPLESLTIAASGEIETEDTHGIVTGQIERLPLGVFLRETALTRPSGAIRALAEDVRDGNEGEVVRLHAIMDAIRTRMEFDTSATVVTTPGAEAFTLGHGVCQDFAHVFIAAARHLGVPARYVSGYLYQPSQRGPGDAGHGWAEAYVAGIGWVGFDAANGVSPTEAYVRVAVGLDYLDAAPVRGSRYGGTDESLEVRLSVDPAAPAPGRAAPNPRSATQSQTQSQTL